MIRLEDVTVARGGRCIVERLTLEIEAGEAVAVIGASASGKTALLETVAGVARPQHGSVRLGASATGATGSPPPRVGFAASAGTAWPVIRADEFLEMAARAAGLTGKPLRLAVERGLGFARCEAFRDQRLDRFSDGQQKRLMLAASLVHDPDLLVADDPCRSLDPVGRQAVEQVVTDMALAGGTILAAINDAAVGSCWSRLLLLHAGGLLDTGGRQPTPDSLWPAWSLAPLAAWRRRLVDPG
jgi:ABC-type multidrug transport system ATPase subunit